MSTCRTSQPALRPLALLAAVALLFTPVGAFAQNAAMDITGDWSLYYRGSEVEVGKWSCVPGGSLAGETLGGSGEIRGPYQIGMGPAARAVRHHGKVWLVIVPRDAGVRYSAFWTSEGCGLGPSFPDIIPTGEWPPGPPKFQEAALELRVRPGADEIEIWRSRTIPIDRPLTLGELSTVRPTVLIEVTEYTLRRAEYVSSFSGAPDDVIF